MESETNERSLDEGERLQDRNEEAQSSQWNEQMMRSIKAYLENGQYPVHLPYCETVRRRNFRKRAKEFVVQDGNLYYKKKKDGSLRLAISCREQKQRVFQVHFLWNFMYIMQLCITDLFCMMLAC